MGKTNKKEITWLPRLIYKILLKRAKIETKTSIILEIKKIIIPKTRISCQG